MSNQSPKSQRAHGPGERPAEDNPPYSEQGGTVAKRFGPTKGDAHVPDHGPRGSHQGGIQSGEYERPTHSPAPHPAGSPGYVDSEDAQKKGGQVERFVNDRGGNS